MLFKAEHSKIMFENIGATSFCLSAALLDSWRLLCSFGFWNYATLNGVVFPTFWQT
jgi:hypothetical protein